MSREATPGELDVGLGTTVYDEEGRKLGTVRGIDEDGFHVTVQGGMAELSVEHSRSSGGFGAAELMWRCSTCGQMGDLDDGLPEGCPNCDAPKEDLEYWKED